MKIIQSAIVVLAFVVTGFSARAESTPVFPPTVADDLNGASVQLPSGLTDARAIIIAAFQREQQANVDGWVDGMMLRGSPVAWLELPVIENPGALGRWFITNGMRGGVLGTDARAHVVSLYLDKAAFLASLGITDEESVYAMVVDRDGHVLQKIKGDYSPEGAKKIWQALATTKH